LSAGKILVATDDPHTSRVITTTLVAHGYEVLDAGTGERALQTVLREMPHLALLDMNLPGISGLDVCLSVRSESDIPVIILSVTDEERVVALDAGADDYVTKPFLIEELLARIRAVLRRSPRARSTVAGSYRTRPNGWPSGSSSSSFTRMARSTSHLPSKASAP
jgi:DNA-binding response OmpR family regulator